MKSFLSKALIGAGIIVTTGFAVANTSTNSNSGQFLPYVGLEGGYAKLSGLPQPVSARRNYGGRLYLGLGYKLASSPIILGAETGAGLYSEAKLRLNNENYLMKAMGWDGLLTATWQASDLFSLTAKGGTMYELFKVKDKNVDSRAFKPMLGATALFSFSKHFGLTASYYHVFGDNIENDIQEHNRVSKSDAPTINAAFLGFRVTF